MCGLRSKLLCPEFVCLIEQYDIIGIQRSKLDDVDNINIKGYQVFTNNRTAISRHRSGGIAILFKNELSPYITVYKTETNSPFGLPFQSELYSPTMKYIVGYYTFHLIGLNMHLMTCISNCRTKLTNMPPRAIMFSFSEISTRGLVSIVTLSCVTNIYPNSKEMKKSSKKIPVY